jgi:carboxyl-terminal processing protease
MEQQDRQSRRRERFVWAGVTAVLAAVLFAVAIPTQVYGQSNRAGSERLLSMFEDVFRFVQNNYVDQVQAEELIQGALDGMFDSLDDPYSAYLSPDDMRNLTDTTQGQFGGVGMFIAKQGERANRTEDADENSPESDQSNASESGTGSDDNGYVEVVSPIEDTPAYHAGIRAGDLIVSIEGDTTEDISIDRVVERLRGRPGSDVTITIRRGRNNTFPVTLTRAIIEVPTVKRDMIGEEIGFLRVIQFTPYTNDRVTEAIDYFEKNGFSSMIIDLRQNPGGVLSGVVDTADLFFDDGVIVGTRGRRASENQVFRAEQGTEIDSDIPIVVLVDQGTASAAEILAGALKDRGRGFLIGETTFGKGSVQQVKQIGMGGFRLTMSKYYTPSGDYISGSGVSPNKSFSPPELSDAQIEAYSELRNNNRIQQFVEQHDKNPTQSEIRRFVTRLQENGNPLPDRELRKMVRDEVRRLNNNPTVYDLDYDLMLQEAVRMIREGELPSQ